MYRKGEVEVDTEMFGKDYVIQLPHSCDYWVIGGAEEARQLIADLEAAIPVWEAKNVGTIRDR